MATIDSVDDTPLTDGFVPDERLDTTDEHDYDLYEQSQSVMRCRSPMSSSSMSDSYLHASPSPRTQRHTINMPPPSDQQRSPPLDIPSSSPVLVSPANFDDQSLWSWTKRMMGMTPPTHSSVTTPIARTLRATSSDSDDDYIRLHHQSVSPPPGGRDVSLQGGDDSRRYGVFADTIDTNRIGKKVKCCCCRMSRRSAVIILVFIALTLITLAIVVWELFQLLSSSVTSSSILINELCTAQTIGMAVTAVVHNPSWFTVTIGPATIYTITSDVAATKYASVDIPAIALRHGDNNIDLQRVAVNIINEHSYIQFLQTTATNSSMPSLNYMGDIPLAIDVGFTSVRITRDINSLVGGGAGGSGGGGGGGGGVDDSFFQKAVRSAEVHQSSFTQPGEPGVYLLGNIALSFSASLPSFGIDLPSLSLHWLIRLNGDLQHDEHMMKTQTTPIVIGGDGAKQQWNISAQVTEGGYNRLRDVATQLWNNQQTQVVISGSGHDSPLRAECYLQWTMDRLVIPITIPTSSNGEPLLQLKSLQVSKYSGSSFTVDSDITINSPLIRKVSTPEIDFDVVFDGDLLGQMMLPSLQLTDGQTRYRPSLTLKLTDDPDRTALAMSFLSSMLLNDEVPLTIRATDSNDKLAGLLASCVQSVSFTGMSFLRSWMKDIVETLSWSAFDTHEGSATLTVTLPVRNPLSDTIMVQQFFTLLRDHRANDIPILSISLNNTMIPSGDSDISALITVYTGSSLGSFFRRSFFGGDVNLLIDIAADTDITGSFQYNGFAINVDGHNYFKDVVQDIDIKPEFPILKPLKRECQMDLVGTANVKNPLPATVTVNDLHFVVMLHDDDGSFGYPPLPKDQPIRVGVAYMVPFHEKNDTNTVDVIDSSSSSSSPDVPESSDSSSPATPFMMSLPASSIQPIRLRLTSNNWEVCMRTFGAGLRHTARLDLIAGTVGLAVDDDSYSFDFDAMDVDVPL